MSTACNTETPEQKLVADLSNILQKRVKNVDFSAEKFFEVLSDTHCCSPASPRQAPALRLGPKPKLTHSEQTCLPAGREVKPCPTDDSLFGESRQSPALSI